MSSPRERIVTNKVRLDLLCCLVDDPPSTVTQLSARVGRSLTAVAYHVKLLETHDLVRKTGETDNEEPLYAATLDEHDEWLWEAVEAHRRG
jgi:DNA-binding transcriptional ArsR family regulator